MSIRPEDVRHIAHLSRLSVDERRIESLTAELRSILDHMQVLQAVDTTHVAPTAGVGTGGTPLRPDSGPPIRLERGIESFAPELSDGFLLVPRLATHTDEEEERAP